MGEIGPQATQQVIYLGIIIQQNGSTLGNFILVFFPSKKIGEECNEEKQGHKQGNGTNDLPGSLIACKASKVDTFFFFLR